MNTMADRLIEAMMNSAADEDLVLASLVHDVGRYAVAQEEISDTLERVEPGPGMARGHHEAGSDLFRTYVPERVAFLVRAHADAKRYLCASEPGYYDTLSKGSKHTLVLQGGAMTAGEIVSAGMQPWWPDALRLRRWDDQAKVVGKPTRDLASWEPLLRKYFSAPRAGR